MAGARPRDAILTVGLGIGAEHTLDFDRIIDAIILVIIDFVADTGACV